VLKAGIFSPVGTFENSPAIHCRDQDSLVISRPVGTFENSISIVPMGRKEDGPPFPGNELPGYFQTSYGTNIHREKTMMDWITENIDWLFSGLGIVTVGWLISLVKKRKPPDTPGTRFDNRADTIQSVIQAEQINNLTITDPQHRNPAEILRIYRNTLIKRLRSLPLRGVDIGVSDPGSKQDSLQLDKVYIELDTKTQVPVDNAEKKKGKNEEFSGREKTRILSALEASANNRMLVITGEPGSGKSTFVNHLGLCLATYGQTQSCLTHRLSCWQAHETDTVPILVILRDFALWVSETETQAGAKPLWDFIVSRLESENLGFADKVLEDALENGKAVLLLDGLDEIPTQEKRTFIRDTVVAFTERYDKSRCIVTCRILSYQNPEWQLSSFPEFELAPFDDEKINGFIGAWYNDLYRLEVIKTKEESEALSEKLRHAVQRRDLRRLASNPLLLTVMSLVHTHKGRLPDARALLYEETTDILLWRWEQIKTAGGKSLPLIRELLNKADRTDMDLKKILWKLAFDAHEKGIDKEKEAAADIQEWELSKALAGLHPKKSRDWAESVIHTLKVRAGLLIERETEVWSFPHRTFQEYLAGAWLSSQANFAKKASELAESGSYWREVILLAVGRLVYFSGDSDKPLALAGELCPEQTGDTDAAWRKIWLAGEVLNEMGMNRVEDSDLGKDLAKRIINRLRILIEEGHLEAAERAAAGNVLGKLGDPRFNPDMFYLPCDEELGFVKIPAGEFPMGSDTERDKDADDDELLHTVFLSEYYIARYPVTMAQFRAFVQDSEYQPEGKWERYSEYPNHPVVRVTWNDAVKYCEWLTGKLKHTGWIIKLPTEAQWEKAARGTDGRIYPWGDGADPDKANYEDTGINTTSAVGCFPKGASPYGCFDMAGNVWEWCRDWYGDYSIGSHSDPIGSHSNPIGPHSGADRVLRGGSCYDLAWYCRSAYRSRNAPDNRGSISGFRLVASPRSAGQH
jgi:formylglycine-generating enzyme required for sulfatase activity/energy-coupling factor transporter ATP-binding protein EcfA2